MSISEKDWVAGLDKGLKVIRAFEGSEGLLTVRQIANKAQITRTAARRYLLTLTELGYAKAEGKQFGLQLKVLELGQAFLNSAKLPRLVNEFLHKLTHALQEASSAGVLQESEVMTLAANTSGRSVSATLQPGSRLPAYCTANGRVLLAALSEEDLLSWFEQYQGSFTKRTTFTHTDTQRIHLEIARVRQQGFALVDQELEIGLRTLAVPLLNKEGNVLAAINVSVHAERMSTDELRARCLPALLQTQARLKTLL